MLNSQINIAFIGGGKIAQAMIAGITHQGHSPQNIMVCAPTEQTRQYVSATLGVHTSARNSDAIEFADVIILAVKPEALQTVCRDLNRSLQGGQLPNLLISVVTGTNYEAIQRWLSGSERIICAMPNLACSIGKGITGMFAPRFCMVQDFALAQSLMQMLGETIWLESEHLLSSVVAASDSAPTCFYLIMEVMQNMAVEQGLSREEARACVQQAALGATSMAAQSDRSFAQLRDQVTSVGGANEQTLTKFEQLGIENMVRQAMQSAANNAKATDTHMVN